MGKKTKEDKNVKTIRLKIIKPINSNWEDFGLALKNLRYYSSKILNYTTQKYYEWQIYLQNFYNENGYWLKGNELKNKEIEKYGKSLSGYIYTQLINNFPNMHTGNLSQTKQFAEKNWKNSLEKILKLQMSIPSYKLKCPIFIHNSAINNIKKEEENYIIKLGLLSPNHNITNKNGEKIRGNYEILVNAKNNSIKVILDRIINEEYKLNSGQIINKDGDWFINISYTMTKVENKTLDKNKILGVDLGIVNAVVLQIYNATTNEYEYLSWYKSVIEGGEIERFRQQIEKRKVLLQKQSKWCGEGRIGHGRKTRNKPIDIQIHTKISNFRNTINHNYSRYIVDLALKNGCGVIQMEDLSGVSQLKKKKKKKNKEDIEEITDNDLKEYKNSKFLKNWSYYDLQQKIKYKAEQAGIEVIFIKPKYTSQRCSSCGYIDSQNRPTQEKFKCLKCGYEVNADINAARNIAIPYIDMTIEEQVKEENKEAVNT